MQTLMFSYNSRGVVAGLVVVATVTSANALTINRNFISSGNSFGNGYGNAEAAPTTAGGGNLNTIFNAAADAWESAINDVHTVDINFGWQTLSGGTLGVHALTGEGGTPHRETSAVIRFDADRSTWFADATPTDNSEYETFTQTNVMRNTDAGMQLMNEGCNFTDATGHAVDRYDLFSVALHEIGHALGLSSANDAFQTENADGDIDIDFGQYAGLSYQTTNGAHINCSTCLMYPFVGTGERNLISNVDILTNAAISEFRDLNLKPVPEPTTMTILGLGALAALRRKKKA